MLTSTPHHRTQPINRHVTPRRRRRPWSVLWTVAAALLCNLFTAGEVSAALAIDPDGTGGADFLLTSLDWNVGNALSKNAIPASSTVGATFVTYFQSSLSLFNTTTGVVAPFLGGYEWTMVAGVEQVVTSVTGTTTNLALAPAATVNFITIYYDPTRDANNLAGTGFDDGTPILRAVFTSMSSSFTVTGGGAGTNLDQVMATPGPVNNYPGISTVTGSGSTVIEAKITYFDPAFFTNMHGVGYINLTFANSSLVLPFLQGDPSARFVDNAGNTITPNLGPINGVTGPDFQFQTDANQSFRTDLIPEPGTAVMLGMACLALLSRRRPDGRG